MNEEPNFFSKMAQKRWGNKSEQEEKDSQVMNIAREQNYLNSIKEKNEIINNLQKKIKECDFLIQNIDNVKSKFPFIYHIFNLACDKVHRKGKLLNGTRYSVFLIPYILILSLFGKKLSLFLHIILGFPVWKTIVRWRQKYIENYKICLDGSIQSIENMIVTNMSDVDDKRVVLAIDAASVTARVSVSKNGEVKGLLTTKWTAESDKILSSPQEFAAFVNQHEHEIIRYFFVVYVCPLCPTAKSFPLLLIPKCSGNANREIVENFFEIIEIVKKMLTVVGIAFDGDSGWLHLAKDAASKTKDLITKTILESQQLFSLDKYIVILDDHPLLIFEDLLHLVKCFRYRLCSGCSICPSLYSDENNFINRENFESVGIPKWILDDAKYLKMDDGLPLKLFTIENVEKCVMSGRIDLAYALIPCTLLITAVMNEEIDRFMRIEMLSIGYAIVFLYLSELEQYSKHKKERLQKTSKNGGKNVHLTLMDKKFCSKYLSLCSSLVYVLSETDAVHLGSLGTHWLEHFFGQVRQVSRGNDTYERFEHCVYNAVLANMLEQEIGIQLISTKRSSSSGAVVEKTENLADYNLSFAFYFAAKLHRTLSFGVYCEDLFNKIEQFNKSGEMCDPIEYLVILLNFEHPIPKERTTLSERLTVSVCKSQKKNLSISSQLEKISQENEDFHPETNEQKLPTKSKRSRSRPNIKEIRKDLDESNEPDDSILIGATLVPSSQTVKPKFTKEKIDPISFDQVIQTTIPVEIAHDNKIEIPDCEECIEPKEQVLLPEYSATNG